jgi:hypothetical protein
MPYSNYPAASPRASPCGLPILQTNPGKVFWVSNATTGLLAGPARRL